MAKQQSPDALIPPQPTSDSLLPPWWLAAAAIALLVIDAISLHMSYGPATSEPWLIEYGSMLAEPPQTKIMPLRMGGVYEFLRAALVLLAATMTLGSVFREEFFMLLGLYPVADVRQRNIFRTALIILAIILSVLIVYYHCVFAPQALEAGPNRWTVWRDFEPVTAVTSDGRDAAYYRPYRWYMPYSFINYIAVWLPVCIVAVFAAARDVGRIAGMRTESRTPPAAVDVDLCKALVSRFAAFAHSYAGVLKRYSWLFMFIAAAITYEQAFSWTTLASGMVVMAYASYITLGLGIVIVLFTLRWYEEEVSNNTRELLEARCSTEVFEDQYRTTRFLLRTMRGSIALIVAVALIGMFFGPAAKLLEWVL